MRPKTTGKKLPPRMVARRRNRQSGKIWIGYYYSGRDKDGKRVEIPLGMDLNAAKRKWAELEGEPVPTDVTLMQFVFDQYVKDILPSKAPGTQRENNDSLRQLRKSFDKAPIDALTPQDIARYRDARSAKVRANREVTLLSHVFNMAREWGYTKNENPCRGVRKNKETPRDFYADKEVWTAVHQAACTELQDAMDLNYLTGQRPGDVLKMRDSDIQNGALHVRQGKTAKFLRIMLQENGITSELASVIDRIQGRPGRKVGSYLVILPNGEHVKKWHLRVRFDAARTAAIVKSTKQGNEALADRIKAFQFRDIRAKSASEIVDVRAASALLGHTEKEITERVYRRIGQAVSPTR
jgi:integrase